MRMRNSVPVALVLGLLTGCSFISPDTTAEALKANADTTAKFRINVAPDDACQRTARMLMWCAGGPNFHYRCNMAPGGAKAELSGVLEAIYRTEYFLVASFERAAGGSAVSVYQRDSILVHDYAPLIEKHFTKPDCQPR